MEELRRKTKEQFQSLHDQLEQAKAKVDQAVKAEQEARQELNALSSLKRQNSSSNSLSISAAPAVSPPPVMPSTPTSKTDFKMLEEERVKAENKRREALDDLTKAKRDYTSAKREAIQLAESVDRLRTGLNKAALQAGGNLALAADRCDDALRQCSLQIEAAVAAIQARELAQTRNPSQSAGLAQTSILRHRESTLEDASSPSSSKKEQEPEERLVNALNEAERRLDEMTSNLRSLLPKVRQVASVAVQDKKPVNVMAQICNFSALFAKLFARKDNPSHQPSYQGLERSGTKSRNRRIEPDTPGTESDFQLEEETDSQI